MKLHDYKCTCGTVVERMSDKDLLPCSAPNCLGWATRQLGGHPVAPAPNMGGYKKESRFNPVGPPLRLPLCGHEGHPRISVQLGTLEHRQVPKARA